MINRVKIKETRYIDKIKSITCDICKKDYDDVLEIQEFHHIHFVGGYNSVFGDESMIECDVCQHCLYEMIKNNYRES